MRRVIFMIACVLASSFMSPKVTSAEPSIDVLVAVAQGPYSNGTDPMSSASDFEIFTTQAMLDSGIPLKHFNYRGYVPVATPGLGSSPNAAAAIAAVGSDLFLQAARNTALSTIHSVSVVDGATAVRRDPGRRLPGRLHAAQRLRSCDSAAASGGSSSALRDPARLSGAGGFCDL